LSFNKDILKIDCSAETDRICSFIHDQVTEMKRDGAVIGVSGGIDSAVCSALCVRALGKDKVLGLLLPERESNEASAVYAAKHSHAIGLNTLTADITPTLMGFGTYEKRDKVIKSIFPEFDASYGSKIVLPSDLIDRDAFNFFTLKIIDRNGQIKSSRLNNQALRGIVAATNTKQITRMMHLNYFADLNNYLVCGTTNRSETVQGFFVKFGDGGVDIEPIAHLYKLQVYQLANYLGVIDEIIKREPSPDTFSFKVTDEEMFFRIPFETLDLLLYAWENKVPVDEVCEAMNLTQEQVNRAIRDIISKFNTTKYLREPPINLNSKSGNLSCREV
jgi:NAD+ synthase